MPRLVEAPLDIADVVREKLLGLSKVTTEFDDPPIKNSKDNVLVSLPRSWIFTSATLGSDASLSWFTKPCGLESSEILQVQSPFDYPNNALLYIPKSMVKPSDANHSREVSDLDCKVVDLLGGRTLVLTTTNRALKFIGDHLSTHYQDNKKIEVMVQGQLPKRFLMERFRENQSSNLSADRPA